MFAKFLAFHDMISCIVRRHMMPWIEGMLAREVGGTVGQRKAWLVTLRSYLGHCRKKGWKEVEDRRLGRQFWREAVRA